MQDACLATVVVIALTLELKTRVSAACRETARESRLALIEAIRSHLTGATGQAQDDEKHANPKTQLKKPCTRSCRLAGRRCPEFMSRKLFFVHHISPFPSFLLKPVLRPHLVPGPKKQIRDIGQKLLVNFEKS